MIIGLWGIFHEFFMKISALRLYFVTLKGFCAGAIICEKSKHVFWTMSSNGRTYRERTPAPCARRLQKYHADHYGKLFKVETKCGTSCAVCALSLDYGESLHTLESYKIVENSVEKAISQLDTLSSRQTAYRGHREPFSCQIKSQWSVYFKYQYKALRNRRRPFLEQGFCSRLFDMHLLWYAVLSKPESP